MSIYFIRHGESEANEQNQFAGRLNTPLTRLGRKQAEKAGKAIRKLGLALTEAHVSTLDRARDTARTILFQAGFTDIPVIETELLIERDFGVLSGKNKSLSKKALGHGTYEHFLHDPAGTPPEGESWAEMYERTRHYYHQVLVPSALRGEKILVVAHKYIIEMFALVVSGLEPADYFDFKIPNSSPSSVEDLRNYVKKGSPAMNQLGELTEIHLPVLLAGAAVVGMLGKRATGLSLSPSFFSASMLLLLAIQSGFSFLRTDPSVILSPFKTAPGFRTMLRGLGWAFVLRTVGGFTLVRMGSGLGQAAGLFLLLPPAISAPQLSLLWGGNYYGALQTTVILSLLSPVLIGSVLPGGFPLLFPFLMTLGLAVVAPAVGAQIFRGKKPIQAGALSSNWGWLGGAALIPLAALSSFYFMPARGSILGSSELLTAIGLLLGLRVFAQLTKPKKISPEACLDRFICQSSPNIFLWFSLLPSLKLGMGSLPIWTILIFFFAIALDERLILNRFQATFQIRKPLAQKDEAGQRVFAGSGN